MDLETLQEIVNQYEYSRANILNNGMQIFANTAARQFLFIPFYDFSEGIRTGACSELMIAAYQHIKSIHPNHHVLRVVGEDADYFVDTSGFKNARAAKHSFLIVYDGRRFHHHLSQADLDELLTLDPILVDPCFQRVMPFLDSGYRIHYALGEEVVIACSTEYIAEHQQASPLGITAVGELVTMGVVFDPKPNIKIGFKWPRSYFEVYDLDSVKIDQRLADEPVFGAIVNKIRETPIQETADEIEEVAALAGQTL